MPVHTLQAFSERPIGREHDAYQASVFSPVAPEYTVGDVLLGAAYRKLVLKISEAEADLPTAKRLAEVLGSAPSMDMSADQWTAFVGEDGSLVGPHPERQRGVNLPPRLLPLVPELARYGGVLGNRAKSRWNPGALLASCIDSGLPPAEVGALLDRFEDALRISPADDVLARFLEERLKLVRPLPGRPRKADEEVGAWRSPPVSGLTPAERFCRDLEIVVRAKSGQTRRQWTALVEALLRIGLGTHMLWICRLNRQVWTLVGDVVENGQAPSATHVKAFCWGDHIRGEPFLELGADSVPWLRRAIRDYVQARIGINLVLQALEAAGQGWGDALGVPAVGTGLEPADEIARFLAHLETHGQAVRTELQTSLGNESPRHLVPRIADNHPRLLASSSGPAENMFFFLRYSMGQLQAREIGLKAHDQGYLLAKANRSNASPWPVDPGPVMLLLLVHCCCQSVGGAFVGIDDLREYLGSYGIHAPAGTLQRGIAGKQMERLGLVVDSPDAGGGRLLVDPFS